MSATVFPVYLVSGFIFLLIVFIWVGRRKRTLMSFLLQIDGNIRLTISTDTKWKETDIRLDNRVAATVSRKDLLNGYDLRTPGGSVLRFTLNKNFMQRARLQITVDGQPVAPLVNSFENEMIINNAAGMIYMIAAINLVAGFLALYYKPEILTNLNIGWLNIAYGLVFIVLGIFTARKSALALVLFILAFGLDSGAFLFLSLLTFNPFLVGIFLIRMAFLAVAFIGLGEILQRRKSGFAGLSRTAGIVLIVISLLGFTGGMAWALYQASNSIRQLTSQYPGLKLHFENLSTALPAARNETCNLRVSNSVETLNIRDKADASEGKVLDILYKGELAMVLGSDGGSSGAEWWFIELEHDGRSIQGWVSGKYSTLESSKACADVRAIATPYP